MITFLVIYILGAIAFNVLSFWIILKEDGKVRLGGLIITLLISVFSWFSVFVALGYICSAFWDTTIYSIKK